MYKLYSSVTIQKKEYQIYTVLGNGKIHPYETEQLVMMQ